MTVAACEDGDREEQVGTGKHAVFIRVEEELLLKTTACCSACQLVALVRLPAFSSEPPQQRELKQHQKTSMCLPCS